MWWPNTSGGPVQISKSISLNVWHQVVVSQEGTSYSIYFDGTLAGSGTTIAINNAYDSGGIGSWEGTSFFSGLIDDVRTFNRSLTAQEVQRIYVEEAPRHLVVAALQSGHDVLALARASRRGFTLVPYTAPRLQTQRRRDCGRATMPATTGIHGPPAHSALAKMLAARLSVARPDWSAVTLGDTVEVNNSIAYAFAYGEYFVDKS